MSLAPTAAVEYLEAALPFASNHDPGMALSLDDHVAQLAHHYARSGNPRKAVHYCLRAVQQCAFRGARAEALAQFETGLEQLQKLPDDDQRAELELDLRNAAFEALFAIEGAASLEMEQSYMRAVELCRRPRINSEKRWGALTGFYQVRIVRGDVRKACKIAPEMIAVAEESGNALLIADAIGSLGFARILSGDFELAAPDQDRAMALLDSVAKLPQAKSWMLLYDQVTTGIITAWDQWFLGYPDRALDQVSIATEIARESGFKTIVKVGHNFAATFFEFRRDFEQMRELAEAALKLSTESRDYDPHSKIYLGWADAMAGDLESGVARIRDHTSKALAAGYEIFCDHYLALIATALGRMGRFDEGLRTIDESVRLIERTGQRYYEAEVHRLNGELILGQDASNAAQAEQSFRTAIDISRKQRAKSWELRATTSLARLLDKQGKRDEARTMLAEIYNWFTEGFDTADLKDAKALLEELGT